MAKNNIQVLKGFRDYLPQEQIARRKIVSKISEVFERFGFAPIETPALEPYELLKGKIGEDEKLIYKFKDLGERDVALRYDLTLSLARVAANYPELQKPFKRYSIGPVWRAENTQKGRFRELTQCDVDVIGADSLAADAEVIAALYQALMALEIPNVKVKFNNRQIVNETLISLGCSTDLVTTFLRTIDKLDKVGDKKVAAMLKEKGLNIKLDEYRERLLENAKDYISEFENMLGSFGVSNFAFDPFLARGLDYYTGTIFEFILADKPEFGSITGGGRYDNLIERVSGQKMPAVGGSIGLDRLFAALQELGLIAPQTAAEVIVLNLDKKLTAEYLNMTTNLRSAGIDTEFYYEPAKLDKQFKYAQSKNMKLAVIMGTDEAKKRKVNIKNLEEKKQVMVDLDDLATEVKSMLW